MFDVVIYTRDICEKCNELKGQLKEYEFPYTEKQIDVDVTRESVLEMKPDTLELPLVYDRDLCRWFTAEWVVVLARAIFLTKQNLSKGLHEIRFLKEDGSERVMKATRDMTLIPVEKHPKGTRKEKTGLIPVFDTEKQEWRSFKILNFIEGKAIND